MWYIITPWKKKKLGKDLPQAVVKHGKQMPLNVYMLKYAAVMYEEKGGEEDVET